MIEITEITDDYKQSFFLESENKERFKLELFYTIAQESWYFNFTYKDITINSQKLITDFDILKQYKNIIPFSLACINENAIDPAFLDSFIDGTTQLFILSRDEVDELLGDL